MDLCEGRGAAAVVAYTSGGQSAPAAATAGAGGSTAIAGGADAMTGSGPGRQGTTTDSSQKRSTVGITRAT